MLQTSISVVLEFEYANKRIYRIEHCPPFLFVEIETVDGQFSQNPKVDISVDVSGMQVFDMKRRGGMTLRKWVEGIISDGLCQANKLQNEDLATMESRVIIESLSFCSDALDKQMDGKEMAGKEIPGDFDSSCKKDVILDRYGLSKPKQDLSSAEHCVSDSSKSKQDLSNENVFRGLLIKALPYVDSYSLKDEIEQALTEGSNSRCRYSLIQYSPEIQFGEFVNIGVVLSGGDQCEVMLLNPTAIWKKINRCCCRVCSEIMVKSDYSEIKHAVSSAIRFCFDGVPLKFRILDSMDCFVDVGTCKRTILSKVFSNDEPLDTVYVGR